MSAQSMPLESLVEEPSIAEPAADEDQTMSGEALYRLGLEASLGENGEGFDLISAHKWFNLAAMRGNLEARAYRAELAKEMTADEIAEAQRLAREYLAVHKPRVHG